MFVDVGRLSVQVRIDGRRGSPDLVLLHSLGTDHRIWDAQAEILARSYRVIRPDIRGHGGTEALPGDYTMAELAADLAGLLDALGIDHAVIGGISIGGMIAQRFAADFPGRADALILCDTAMAIPTIDTWRERAATVRAQGIGAIEDGVVSRWVTPAFIDDPAARGLRTMLRRTSIEGYTGCAMAIGGADLTDSTSGLRLPALVLVGEHDQSTPVASSQALVESLAEGGSPNVQLVVLENAAHIPTVERAHAVTDALAGFLADLGPDDPYEAGLAVRRAVLGDAHVARSLSGATDFDRDFQDYITETAWGRIWTRPGLPRHVRSLLVLAITASLGREEEFRLHLRATRNTGATQAEIAEALMQVAVYAGVPAANSAIRMAKEILAEDDAG
jgi:3-oxoadipate enol-lactonase/4-carboxymuconolactone decarboxylase